MADIQECFLRSIWREMIFKKARRVELQAKELLGKQVNQVDSKENTIINLSESLNTGKLKKLMNWLFSK